MRGPSSTPEVVASIRSLSEQGQKGGDDLFRKAAVRTGGLPVYADMGGVLVVTESLEILLYEPETDSLRGVADERWRIFALVKAAQKFPSLATLRPQQPASAVACSQCGGQGVVLGGLDCGRCFGVGWVEPHSQ